jgi:hypothetical protein
VLCVAKDKQEIAKKARESLAVQNVESFEVSESFNG